MRIDFISLKNYRPYLEAKIVFSNDEKHKNFTIVQGANGAGKSSLLNAITWCLYNEEVNLKTAQKGLPIFNTEAFENLKKNQILEAKVEIQMIDKEGLKHNFIRMIKYRKSEDGSEEIVPDISSKEKDGSTFQYFRQEGNQSKLLSDPKFFIEQIMPENIKEYFFFDGERLDLYFKESSGEKIKQAVFDISQITIIEKLVNRLRNKKRELLREQKDLGSDIEKLREETEIRQTSLDQYKKDLNEKKYARREAEELEEKTSDELRQYPDSADYESKRKEVEGQINNNEEDIKFHRADKLQKLLKSARSIIAFYAIDYAKTLIDKGIDENKYPPSARKDFIEALLKKNKCICGADLLEHKYRKPWEDLLNKVSTSSEICNTIIKMQGELRSLLDKIDLFDEEQFELSKKINDLEKKRDELTKQQDLLLKKIGSSPIEKIKRLKNRLLEAKKIIKDLIYEVGTMETRISLEQKGINAKNKELTEAMRKQDKYKAISQILQFLDNSIESAEQIRNEIMQEVRQKIQDKTKEQFFSLIWNPEAFKDVMIDEEYNISVIHISGREGIGTLSAGQRQVLALSFMAALKQVSGFDTPIVIDTPLGRLSKEPKNNIAKKLPNYLSGSQVTMLVTEEEYTHEVRDLLKQRVQKEYRIILESPTCAKVVNYVK